jgi:RimJ/RimL family protein N-acetyltransferase
MIVFNKEYFLKRIVTKNVKLVVAEDDKILGFMLVTDANVFVPAQLHLVAINKEERGKGIGKQLVQYAIDYAKENEWEKLKLSTKPWNKAMRKICMNLGFAEEALLRKEYLGEDLIQYGYFPSN